MSSIPNPATTDWVPIWGAQNIAQSRDVRVYRSSAQSVPNAVWTSVIFDTVRYDTGGQWSVANPTRLTCQQSGTYIVSGHATMALAGGSYRIAQLSLNGNIITAISGLSDLTLRGIANPYISVAGSLRLQVGDYIELKVYQDSGAALQIQQGDATAWYAADLEMSLTGGPQGIPGVGVPTPVVNGQWIKGSGGTAIWSPITPSDVVGITYNTISGVVVSAENTDLAWFGGAAPTSVISIWTGGGSIRTLGAPILDAARVSIANWSGINITILHATTGAGKPIYLKNLGPLVLAANEVIDLFYDAQSATWNESNRNTKIVPSDIPNGIMTMGGNQFRAQWSGTSLEFYIDNTKVAANMGGNDAWTTLPLVNGWTHYSAPFGPAVFRKLANGMVVLTGLVLVGAVGAIFAQLPAGFRPTGNEVAIFATASSTPSAPEGVRINPDGSLIAWAGYAAGGWVSMAGISFYGE